MCIADLISLGQNSFFVIFHAVVLNIHHHSVFTGWTTFLPPNQQHQSTEGYNQASTSPQKWWGTGVVICK